MNVEAIDMHIYCSGDPTIGSDWELITAEKFDTYRTSTYFIDSFAQTNHAMNTSLLLGKFPRDISIEWKIQVPQHEVSNSITSANVLNNNIELAESDNHPTFESTDINLANIVILRSWSLVQLAWK